jgi:hypothetical protein
MSDKDNTNFREVASHGRRDFLKNAVALAVIRLSHTHSGKC